MCSPCRKVNECFPGILRQYAGTWLTEGVAAIQKVSPRSLLRLASQARIIALTMAV